MAHVLQRGVVAIPTYAVNGGQDMAVYLSDHEIIVTSKSAPGSWRAVDLVRINCTCEGFQLYGLTNCRHIRGAREAQELDRHS